MQARRYIRHEQIQADHHHKVKEQERHNERPTMFAFVHQ
jgi:hypothetical protein